MPLHASANRVEGWARRLGLARTPLRSVTEDPEGNHHALLDGVDGSFALSFVELPAATSLDWTWSSQLTNHVHVGLDKVLVRPVDKRASVLRFDLSAVDENLEQFFTTVAGQRVMPAVTVVDHITNCFRAHRALAAGAGLSAEASLTTFLDVVNELISENGDDRASSGLTEDHRWRLIEELRYNQLTGRTADLALTMRHAAGMVFQETHAELDAEPVPLQLFGLAPAPKRSTRNRLGAYYTPPGLARTICDLAIVPHLSKETLRILDPACGSGIFLVEVLRALERHNFAGQVELIGFDISASAIEMARFALRHCSYAGTVRYAVEAFDFLRSSEQLDADIILMNPPFVAYEDLSVDLKRELKTRLGEVYSNKPDFSMLFTSLSLEQLKAGGTLATLLPAGVLAQSSATNWRSQIVSGNDIDLLAILGDHGLFRDAMVNISAMILRKTVAKPVLQPTMLWAGQRPGASADALRRLRRWVDGDRRAERTADWSIYQARERLITPKGNWTPRPNSLGELPQKLLTLPGVKTVGSLFQVEQGVRPGRIGEQLIIPVSQWCELPNREQSFFRPVAENRSIQSAQVSPINMMFFPSSPMTADEVSRRLPKFFAKNLESLALQPFEIVEAIRPRRGTNDRKLRRIVARTYVAEDSFAVDPDGSLVVVQGSSWIAKWRSLGSPEDELNLFTDYALLMNSRLFFMLLREFCRIVGGGQVEASKAGTSPAPLPDLIEIYRMRPEVLVLAERLREQNKTVYPPISELDRFAAEAYGTTLNDWVVN